MKLRTLIEGQGIIDETSIDGSKPTHAIVISPYTSKKGAEIVNSVKDLGGKIMHIEKTKFELIIQVNMNRSQFSDLVAEWDIDQNIMFLNGAEYDDFVKHMKRQK